ncbi:hypothetical protein FHW17_002357 [Phyllobacterium sp. P30BS-XVII]|nr:hypothetical protein [Phyllobacterium sp. P30BS-XVII]
MMGYLGITPLCPVGLRGEPRVSPVLRTPHKGGDHIDMNALHNRNRCKLCKGSNTADLPPCRAEGGEA